MRYNRDMSPQKATCAALISLINIVCGPQAIAADRPLPKVPPGYTVQRVAGPPLVQHPVMACFDERGRMFVADNAGLNLRKEELEKQTPNMIRLLEDTDGDGVFDKSTVFADKMTFPQGALWHDGALYVASPPGIWRLEDTDDDGKADKRKMLVRGFEYTGNAASVHGPFLHPNGRLFFCHGRKGHKVYDAGGKLIHEGKAAAVWSMYPDGTDVEMHATGGMDNPVELVFTPEGDVIGTCNLFYARPRGDTLVHWVYGGVYPRKDFVDKLSHEFIRTGPLLPEIHNFGHVAVSGLCRYRGDHLGPNPVTGPNPKPTDPHILYVTQFNTRKVIRVELQRHGSTYRASKVENFLTSDDPDFRPTDVFEDADGSLLVVDTGGWFRIGCPVSQVAKPDIKGAIYRVRKVGAPHDVRTYTALLKQHLHLKPNHGIQPQDWRASTQAMHRNRLLATRLARSARANDLPKLLWLSKTEQDDPILTHAIVFAMIRIGDTDALSRYLNHSDLRVRSATRAALAQMKRSTADGPSTIWTRLPPASFGQQLDEAQLRQLRDLINDPIHGDPARGRTVFAAKSTACAACHSVKGEPNRLGPDLSKVGAIRGRRDLLQSILFPSAGFARGYEPYMIETETERHVGVLVGETNGHIELATAAGKVVSVELKAVRSIKPSNLSIMPAGLDKALTKQELADLIAYLQSLK